MKAVEGGFDTAWSRRHVDLCRTAGSFCTY
ncbi:putative leader peptide [Rhodococcus sp. 27YEA15]